MSTQWRVSMAGAVGLDYSAVYLVAGTMEIEITEKLLTKLKVLENQATKKKGEE